MAGSASRALGLIISKFYANGGMPYKGFTKVYESQSSTMKQPFRVQGSSVV